MLRLIMKLTRDVAGMAKGAVTCACHWAQEQAEQSTSGWS
jgi:hypothetical protein